MDTPNYKIAFLFLVIDDINFPTIWENYFRGNEDKFSIYCHPKNPNEVKTEWLKAGILDENELVPTEWGFITRAYYNLLSAALKYPLNQKFVVVSESCIPLRGFSDLYKKVMSTDDIRTSYIKLMKISNYDLKARIEKQSWNKKFSKWIKHYARFCLSRYHVSELIRKKDKFELFHNMQVGDEFFLTVLDNKFIQNYEITYDNWTDKKEKC